MSDKKDDKKPEVKVQDLSPKKDAKGGGGASAAGPSASGPGLAGKSPTNPGLDSKTTESSGLS